MFKKVLCLKSIITLLFNTRTQNYTFILCYKKILLNKFKSILKLQFYIL
jgi:hypothetical protein